MTEVVIRTENLGKRYRLGQREAYGSLRDVLSSSLRAPWRAFQRRPRELFWALREVNLEVREGEVLGLIGRNGAGKTTLLKILSRITRPTAGSAEVRGRVGSLLEVGTGFHPELTGRENTYLSGAILGMTKKEIAAKFDSIVEFAEIEQFIDTPVKHYSSGMYVRLAFSVAAHLEPEILLVDEVLAVGDLKFQKKCLGRMSEVAQGGRTVLFVSHQMNQIRRLCERVIWFEAGRIQQSGATGAVLGAYEAAMSSGALAGSHGPGAGVKARFVRWEIAEPRSEQGNVLDSMGPVAVKFVVEVHQPVRDGLHGIALYDSERQLIWGTAVNNLRLGLGIHEFGYTLPTLPLRPGVYSWRVTLFDELELLDDWDCVPQLVVSTEPQTHWKDEWAGILNVPSQFSVAPTAEKVQS